VVYIRQVQKNYKLLVLNENNNDDNNDNNNDNDNNDNNDNIGNNNDKENDTTNYRGSRPDLTAIFQYSLY